MCICPYLAGKNESERKIQKSNPVHSGHLNKRQKKLQKSEGMQSMNIYDTDRLSLPGLTNAKNNFLEVVKVRHLNFQKAATRSHSSGCKRPQVSAGDSEEEHD